MAKATCFFFLLLLLLTCQVIYGRLLGSSTMELLDDGISHLQPLSFLHMGGLSASESCEQTYGILPCTTTILGNLFLILVYGYLMFLAATYLSTGCELLLQILGPGIIGGLFLPILGALPDAILILVSGLSGSRETAQNQVLIGMGLLAGSTVMLLTVLWGSCVVVAKVDLDPSPRSFSLIGHGVVTDLPTTYAARIMVISVIPFIVVQVPQIFNLSSGSRLVILVSLVLSILFLLSYCLFQVFQPWIQRRKLEYAKHKHLISGFLRHLHKQSLGKLLVDDHPNRPVIERLFERMDINSDGFISANELRAVVLGIEFVGLEMHPDDAANKMMDEFDVSGDRLLSKDEFFYGIEKWIQTAKKALSYKGFPTSSLGSKFHAITKEEQDALLDKDDDESDDIVNPSWVVMKAIMLLLWGTIIAAVFADPLVDAVDNFSDATGIPSFFISFIAMPLATNSSEAVSALIFASRKKQRSTSLTFSEIYGAVTMNNTLCLAVFLALVYVRHLTWDFSAEVLVILLVSIVMGLFASFRTRFPLWTCFLAYLLYPLSLVLVYVLDYVFGWS